MKQPDSWVYHHTSLRKWVKQFTRGSPTEILNQSEQDELLKLRKESCELRMEKEILKKASAFFAKEMTTYDRTI